MWPAVSDRNSGILSPRLLPFPVISRLLLFCFPWSRASATGKSAAYYFYIRLKDPCLLALACQFAPSAVAAKKKSSQGTEPFIFLSFFFPPVGDVANAVTVIWKSTQSGLLLLLLKPSSSSSGLFMVIDNYGNFVQGSQLTPSPPPPLVRHVLFSMSVCVCALVLYIFDVVVNYWSCCVQRKWLSNKLRWFHMWGEENLLHLLMHTLNSAWLVCVWEVKKKEEEEEERGLPPPTIFSVPLLSRGPFSLPCFTLPSISALFCLQLTVEIWLLEAQGGF